MTRATRRCERVADALVTDNSERQCLLAFLQASPSTRQLCVISAPAIGLPTVGRIEAVRLRICHPTHHSQQSKRVYIAADRLSYAACTSALHFRRYDESRDLRRSQDAQLACDPRNGGAPLCEFRTEPITLPAIVIARQQHVSNGSGLRLAPVSAIARLNRINIELADDQPGLKVPLGFLAGAKAMRMRSA